MVEYYQEVGFVPSAQDIKTLLVPIHVKMCKASMFSHDHDNCEVCYVDPSGCVQIQNDVQGLMDRGELVVTREDKSICVVIPVFKDNAKPTGVVTPVFKDNVKPAVTPLVICVPRPKPYFSKNAIPYNYDPTSIEDGKEIPLSP